MADDTTLVASSLNALIRILRDSEHGFETAARLVEDLNLRHLFESYAKQRAEFATELEQEMSRLTSGALEGGRGGAEGRQNWDDVTSGLNGRDHCAIIVACQQLEERTATTFQQADGADLPQHLRLMVQRQLAEIKEALQHVRSLERAHSRMQ